jgi:hypothetical protein
MDAQFLQYGFDSHVAGRYLLAVGVIGCHPRPCRT